MMKIFIKLRKALWLPIRYAMMRSEIEKLGVHLDGETVLKALEEAQAKLKEAQTKTPLRPEAPYWEGYAAALSWILTYGTPKKD